jgi:nitrogenase molybdenum-iron protein alpha chain
VIKSPRVILTNLDQNDVVMGAEKKLGEAIRLAEERYSPKMIFVFTACASGIIGEDIDSISGEAQKSVKAIVVPVHCDGFRSKISASGFDSAFASIQKYLLPKNADKNAPRDKNLVNLFAPISVSYWDQLEIQRMLDRLGLRCNYLPFFSSLEKIQGITKAGCSTSICKVFADEFMKDLEEDYGIPYAHTVMPVGLRNTSAWLMGVAEQTGKSQEARELIEKEEARVMPRLQSIKKRLEGKKVLICGGTGRSFAAAALISDFGMKLTGLITPVYDNDAQADIDYLNGMHGDFVIDVANMLPFEQVNLVNRLKPDVFLGVPSWSARFGIPTTHILDAKRPTMGYDGILWLGEKMADQIENPGFNQKLSKYARLPYRESWYQSDPFKFIKWEA